MQSPRIAIVSRDPHLRTEAARAFDQAPPDWTIRLFEEPPEDADVVVVCPDIESAGIRFEEGTPAADLLEQVRARLEASNTGVAIAVAGGGGVGATTVALHLAAEFGRRQRTCFVDASGNDGARFRLGLADDLLGWSDREDLTEETLLRSAVPVSGAFRVLLGPLDPERSRSAEVVEATSELFERVVVDLGSCPDASVLAACRAGIMVLPPAIPAGRRASEMLSQHPDMRWAIVTNRLGHGGEATRGMLERILGARIALELPHTPALRDAEDEGRLCSVTWSRWNRRIASLASSLDRL